MLEQIYAPNNNIAPRSLHESKQSYISSTTEAADYLLVSIMCDVQLGQVSDDLHEF